MLMTRLYSTMSFPLAECRTPSCQYEFLVYFVLFISATSLCFKKIKILQSCHREILTNVLNMFLGPKSTMVVQVSGIEHVDRESMRIAIAKEDGAILSSGIVLNMVGESRGILQASFDTPSDKFKILLSGTSKGHQFQRVSRVGYEASDLALVVMNAGEEFTAPIAKASSKINVYVYNGGDSDTFTLSAAAKNSSVVAEADIVRIDKGKNTTVTFDLHPPKNAAWLVGKAATVTVEAIGQSSGKRYLTEVKMIWVR